METIEKGTGAMSLYSATMRTYADMVEDALKATMPPVDTLQRTVSEAMAYSCEAGGKRLRPVLVLTFAELCGGKAADALPFACAMEMIHCYSLVHDDLPCMDNSLLRRGRPSTFAAYGEDMALLAGDGLLTYAFEHALSPQAVQAVGADAAVRAAHCLAVAAGIGGMVGGQTIDLQSEGKAIDLPTLQELHKGKTGALIYASCHMGAIVANAPDAQREAAVRYGTQLGIAFQIVDDILDVTSSEQALGKPIGSDAQNEKSTYVSLLGLDEARRRAAWHTEQALEALDVFGARADDLRAMTKAMLSRDH